MHSTKGKFLAAAAAAALIAGTGGALAQADKKMDAPAGAQIQGGAQGGGGGVDVQKKGGAQTQMRDGGAKVQGQGSGSAQAPGGTKVQGGAQTGAGSDMKKDSAQGRSDSKASGQAQQPSGSQDMQKRDSAQGSSSDSKTSVQLNSEQRTKISQTIKQKDVNLRHVERSRINFNITVGAVVPRSFTLYPLPAPIVAVVPAYRGYLYIVVDDELLIIHPQTYEIVAVIPA